MNPPIFLRSDMDMVLAFTPNDGGYDGDIDDNAGLGVETRHAFSLRNADMDTGYGLWA